MASVRFSPTDPGLVLGLVLIQVSPGFITTFRLDLVSVQSMFCLKTRLWLVQV